MTARRSLALLTIVEQADPTGWRYYNGLFRHLAEEGVSPYLLNLSTSDEFRARVEGSVEVFEELGLKRAYYGAPFKIAAVLRRLRPDVVHAHEFIASGYLRWANVAVRSAPPFVYGRHHMAPLRGMPRMLDRWGVAGAAAIVTNSRFSESYLLEEHPGARERSFVVGNGIELVDGPSQPDDSVIQALAADEGVPVLGVVGRLRPEKGHAVALEAFSILREQGVAYRAVFIGEGAERTGIERDIAQKGLGDIVQVPGATQAMATALTHVDVLVVPSLSESFGIAAIEGLAAGLPVVASSVGGLLDIIRPEKNGLLVPPSDPGALAEAIRRLLHEPETAEAMGRRGREDFERRFTSAVMARGYLEVYRKLVAGNVTA